MTTRIRFVDAIDVFDAFPNLSNYAPRPSTSTPALIYAGELTQSLRPATALTYIAHLLPRREAIWWGCQCVGAISMGRDKGFDLAQKWVRDPDDNLRREALAFAEQSGLQSAASWLARAVGYSGGSLLAPDQPGVQPAPDACALSVNAAIVIAATRTSPLMVLPWMRACAGSGKRFADGEDAKVIAPARDE